MGIEARRVTKAFGSFVALNDVSLHVASGGLVALLGPSGSGKTTLLRVIAGLEEPDAGSVLLEREDATERNVRDRGVGFVFQHYVLFRHMTVFENIAFGLRARRREQRPLKAEIISRVHRLLELVQLDFMADRRSSELSGGQRQRVALGRITILETLTPVDSAAVLVHEFARTASPAWRRPTGVQDCASSPAIEVAAWRGGSSAGGPLAARSGDTLRLSSGADRPKRVPNRQYRRTPLVDNARSADFSESDMSTIRFAKPDDAVIVSVALSSPSHRRFLIGSAVIAAGECRPLRQGVFSVRADEHFNVF